MCSIDHMLALQCSRLMFFLLCRGPVGMLSLRAQGHSAVSNVLQVFTQRKVNIESFLLVMTVSRVRPFHSGWETDDSQWCVNLSAIASTSLSQRARKTGRTLLHINPDGWLQFQKPHCHSLTFLKPPSVSLLIWVMLTEMRIGALWNSDGTLDDQL